MGAQKRLLLTIAVIFLFVTCGWSKTIWTMSYEDDQTCWSCTMHYLQENEIMLTGYSYSFIRSFLEIFLIKAESDGDIIWTRTINDSGKELNLVGRKNKGEDEIVVRCSDFDRGEEIWRAETIKESEIEQKTKPDKGSALFKESIKTEGKALSQGEINLPPKGDLFGEMLKLAGREMPTKYEK